MKIIEAIRRLRSRLLIGALMAVVAALTLVPKAAYATETVILTVSVNAVSQGELFLKRTGDTGLLMRSEDARHIGLKLAAVPIITLDNEPYVALKDIIGVTAVLDEKLLTLDLRAEAARVNLPTVVQNFSPATATYLPSPNASAFINYRLDYGNGTDFPAAAWGATGQAGLRRGNLLLLGDGYYTRIQDNQQAVRLMTSLSWDRPETISRWVAGDIQATAGEPSGPIIMGGIGYSSAYSMAPGMITYPMGQFGGIVTSPTEADIYVNGLLVRRERLAPGNYRFQNLPVSTGANNVEIVMRDSFGNESRSNTHFYLSDTLLKSGLHDYSYNLGFKRLDYGTVSNQYGSSLLVARHMFGYNDSLTVGAGAEAGSSLINLVPRAVINLARGGILNILVGGSSDNGRGFGTTSGIGYQFQSRHVNYQLSLAHNSREYRTLANQQTSDTTRLDVATGISVGTSSLGAVSLNGSYRETYAGVLQRSLGLSYSRAITKSIQFSASVSATGGTANSVDFFAGLTYFPTNSLTTSAMFQSGPGSNKETLSLQSSMPPGEGVGYRATLAREDSQNQTFLRANPFMQVNGSIGSYSADLQGQYDQQSGKKSGSYLLSAAGALVYAGGHLGLSRPVTSSFAVVQVEGLADVKVLLDNQEITRTNANGMAYIPTLQSYQENKITFEDQQIAANYLIRRYKAIVAPGQYGGECIYFPVAKVQSFGGHLLAEDGSPLEYVKVILRGSDREISFTTLKSGEFYFENLTDTTDIVGKRFEACGDPSPYHVSVVPGRYSAAVLFDDTEQRFELEIPVSDAVYVPLGEIRIPASSVQP